MFSSSTAQTKLVYYEQNVPVFLCRPVTRIKHTQLFNLKNKRTVLDYSLFVMFTLVYYGNVFSTWLTPVDGFSENAITGSIFNVWAPSIFLIL